MMPSSLNKRTDSSIEDNVEENESLLPQEHLNASQTPVHPQNLPTPIAEVYNPKVLFIACILLTVVNLAVLWVKSSKDLGAPSPATLFSPVNTLSSHEDVENLRRPSQFVGLDEIYKKYPHKQKNFTNFPLVLTSVDRANPSKIFNPEQGLYVGGLGVILPEHGHLQITPTISSVVQFRATDFMMENCVLHITLPDISKPVSLLESARFELHKLDSTHRLRARKLSYASKPARTSKIGDVKFDNGDDWSFHFPCARDELFTFELSCPEGALLDTCNLDWVQDKEPSSDLAGKLITCSGSPYLSSRALIVEAVGIYMMQFSNKD